MNIIHLDISIFEFINSYMSNGWFDLILPMLREPYFWVPLYVFIASFMFLNFGKKAYWLILFLILTVSSADLISSRVVKPSVKRLRPCRTEFVSTIQRVPCGGGYSFTSSHATNHFAIATFLVLTLGQSFKKINPWLWIWAFIISFSQIYVGVHFPLDVVGGALLGLVLGKLWALLYHKYYGNVLAINI